MNIIDLVKKEHCTGCSACEAVCPKNAIYMEYDDEGFLYPKTDSEKCIDCSLCAKVCPTMNGNPRNSDTPECYAAWNLDDELRLKSSSGGIFGLLADEVLESGGAVVGAAYTDDNYGVHHIIAETKEELQKLYGAKYVQSDMEDVMRAIREKLETGQRVLFSGTPCQVAGLYSYLGKEYEELTTVDVICHGVPSPGVFRTYIEEMEAKYSSKIKSINMRDKSINYWGQSTGVVFANGKKDLVESNNCKWKNAYLSHLIVRPSCYNCKYCSTNRCGDITMGDFWGIGEIDNALFDIKGNSVILVNSPKGSEIWKRIEKHRFSCPAPLEIPKAYNVNLNNNPPYRNIGQTRFFEEWKKNPELWGNAKKSKRKKV